MNSQSRPLASAGSVPLEALLNAALWSVFSVICVGYAALAFDYFIAFASGRDGLWLKLFTALVDAPYARGAGSVHVDQQAAYTAGLPFMLMHTTTGALAMALGPFQFMAGWRRRHPRLHRNAGRIYLISAVMSMFGGLAYLFTTPPTGVFSGPPFAVALVGLDVMVLLTAWLAYTAIRRRAIAAHQTWMAYNFGLLLATPGLRVLWVLFGWAFPELNQAEANLGIMTFLLPLCVSGMLLWASTQPQATRLPAALALPPVLARCLLIAAVLGSALVWLQLGWRAGMLPAQWTESLAFLAPLRGPAGAAWPVALVHALAVSVAMFAARGALGNALAHGAVTPAFLAAAALAALTGAALAVGDGAAQAGGDTMVFYGTGLCALWLLALWRSASAARRGQLPLARDWTVFSAALAFLPLSVLAGTPLWAWLPGMDANGAVITAATIAFAGHYLLSQVLISEGLPRLAAAQTKSSSI